MKTRNITTGLFVAVASLSLIFISCNKKPDQVGLGLQPTSAELSVVFDDETGLLSHSVIEDSVRTDGNVVQTGMVGSMLDPVFGTTTSGVYTQLRLSENGQSFGEDAILDSIVLALRYSGIYGDTLAGQIFRVYEVNEDMDPDTSYYSNDRLEYLETEIGSITFVPNLDDSVNVGGTMELAQLRIKLSEEFGQKIITASDDVFDDNENWLEFMKGVYIISENASSGGSIVLFDMYSSITNMTIYYRAGDPEDTLSFSFLSNSNCARFSAYEHFEYQDADAAFKSQVLNGDTLLGQELFYLQGMGGVKAWLRLPDIESFFDNGPVAINEAKLLLYIYDDGTELEGPPQLALAMVDEEGEYLPLPDASESTSYYGGSINDSATQYYFRISQYVQQVLTGDLPNYPIVLAVSGASFRPQRVLLYGPDTQNLDLRMRLAVKYTKVN